MSADPAAELEKLFKQMAPPVAIRGPRSFT